MEYKSSHFQKAKSKEQINVKILPNERKDSVFNCFASPDMKVFNSLIMESLQEDDHLSIAIIMLLNNLQSNPYLYKNLSSLHFVKICSFIGDMVFNEIVISTIRSVLEYIIQNKHDLNQILEWGLFEKLDCILSSEDCSSKQTIIECMSLLIQTECENIVQDPKFHANVLSIIDRKDISSVRLIHSILMSDLYSDEMKQGVLNSIDGYLWQGNSNSEKEVLSLLSDICDSISFNDSVFHFIQRCLIENNHQNRIACLQFLVKYSKNHSIRSPIIITVIDFLVISSDDLYQYSLEIIQNIMESSIEVRDFFLKIDLMDSFSESSFQKKKDIVNLLGNCFLDTDMSYLWRNSNISFFIDAYSTGDEVIMEKILDMMKKITDSNQINDILGAFVNNGLYESLSNEFQDLINKKDQ